MRKKKFQIHKIILKHTHNGIIHFRINPFHKKRILHLVYKLPPLGKDWLDDSIDMSSIPLNAIIHLPL